MCMRIKVALISLRLRKLGLRMLVLLIHPTSDELQVLTLCFILQALDTSRLCPSKLVGQLVRGAELLVNPIPPLHDVAPTQGKAGTAVDPISCSSIPSDASLLILFIEVEFAETAMGRVDVI